MKKILCVLLGGALLGVTGCSMLWPQQSQRLTNPYGGYAGPQEQNGAAITSSQSNAWLESTLPPPPVSALQASMIEDSAFTSDFLTAVWLRFSKSPAVRQYKQFRASYQNAEEAGEYSNGYADSTPMLLPRHYTDEPYSELRLLARRGDAWAEFYLGDFYVRLATKQWPYAGPTPTLAADPNLLQELHGVFCRHAYAWMQKAAGQNVAPAEDAFGWMEQNGFGGPVNLRDALQNYKLAAAQGDIQAEYQLAEIYSGGATENLAMAVHYYRIVARKGRADAEFALAMAYRRGLGTLQDRAKSDYWLHLADAAQYPPAVKFETKLLLEPLAARARQGDVRSEFALGLADYQGLYEGQHVTQTSRGAAYWFGRAAAQGYAVAQCYYAGCLASGVGVTVDLPTAYRWARRAAWQHLAAGEAMLGQLYVNGEGTPQNYTKAIHWLKLAVAQGNARAECELGWMYATGNGVAQNDGDAEYWYSLAAKQGNSTAQTNLTNLEQGRGSSGMIGAGMVHQMLDQQQQDRINAANEAQAMQRVQDAENW